MVTRLFKPNLNNNSYIRPASGVLHHLYATSFDNDQVAYEVLQQR